MNETKYITFMGNEIRYDGKPPERVAMGIIFSHAVIHRDAARSLFGSRGLQCTPEDILGAGFCGINTFGEVTCWGHSESLDKKTRGQADEDILNKMLGIK